MATYLPMFYTVFLHWGEALTLGARRKGVAPSNKGIVGG
jgi:hypothetical protein